MPKNILIIASNAYAIGPHNRRTGIFLPEAAHPYAEFELAKYQIDFASLTGDAPFLNALHLANDDSSLFVSYRRLGLQQSFLEGTDPLHKEIPRRDVCAPSRPLGGRPNLDHARFVRPPRGRLG